MWYYAKDGQQGGPISREDLVEMLQQRQLAAEVLVWREGLPQWIPANQVGELAPAGPAGMLAQPAPGLGYAQPPQTNSMALTSMVLGICGLVVAGIFTALPAIICGHVARRQIREAQGTQTGEGMALAGLITGYLVTALTMVLVVGIIIFIIFLAKSTSSSFSSSSPAPYTAPITPGPAPTPAPLAPSPGVPLTPEFPLDPSVPATP